MAVPYYFFGHPVTEETVTTIVTARHVVGTSNVKRFS